MSENTPGSSCAVSLVQNPSNSKLNLALCLICQRVKDRNGSTTLTSAVDGRQTIIDTSEKLQDGLVTGIEQSERDKINYHLKSCYSTYRKKGERHEEARKRKAEDEPQDSPLTSPVTRPKRDKLIVSPDPRDKPCIICNHHKCQGETQRFRIETPDKADCLLKAVSFNKDEIHTRMIFMKEIGDVFANDVMYHNNCMCKYLNQFERDVEKLLAGNFGKENNLIKETFDNLVETLNIDMNGYAVADIRDTLNKILKSKNQGKLLIAY